MIRPTLFLLLFVLYGFTPSTGIFPPTNTTKWLISKSGSLKVNGSTNVNKFSCAIASYDAPDTLVLAKGNSGTGGVTLKGEINLPVNAFNCGRALMTSDLRKTLKAKEYPFLKIRFISLSTNPVCAAKQEAVKGWVEIELAGVTKQFEVNYTFSKDPKGLIKMVGQRDINFSDFNLIPPKKLGGMVKTNDQLKVEFQLNLAQVP